MSIVRKRYSIYDNVPPFETPFAHSMHLFQLFNFVKPTHELTEDEMNTPGPYPLIDLSVHNNGIVKFINSYTHDSTCETEDDHGFITVTLPKEDTPPSCSYVHRGKFAVTSNVVVLTLKQGYRYLQPALTALALYIHTELNLRYRAFTDYQVFHIVLHWVPFKIDPITKNRFVIDVSGIKRIYNFAFEPSSKEKDFYPVEWSESDKAYVPVSRIEEVNVSELFERVNVKTVNLKKLPEGPYPLISASGNNNGVIGHVNTYSYDTQGKNVLTVAGSGSTGHTFIQNGKFAIRGHNAIHVLRLKPEYEYLNDALGYIAIIMTKKFTQKYDYQHAINSSRLMAEKIHLPVIASEQSGKNKININLLHHYLWTTLC